MPDGRADWHAEVLPDGWRRAADDLAGRSLLDDCYLAGGTGLALEYGHRRSADLDLFRDAPFESARVGDRLLGLSGLARVALAEGTVHLTLHGVKVSLLHYPYPLLYPPRPYGHLRVADPRDIACMKIQAIGDCGSRRDFVDLFIATRHHSLDGLFEAFLRKYAAANYSRTHYLKALTYFRDAEAQPMPDMLVTVEWSAIASFFLSEVPKLARL